MSLSPDSDRSGQRFGTESASGTEQTQPPAEGTLQPCLVSSAPPETTSPVTLEDEPPAQWDNSGTPPPPGRFAGELPPGGGEPPELGKMSFLDHLEELRARMVRCVIAVAVAFCLCWWKVDWIYGQLAKPLTQVLQELHMDDRLVYTNPTEPFTIYMELALVAGLFLSSGYILAQVWGFISPGLYRHEKRYALPFVVLCTSLFLGGGAFAYYAAFPAALRFLLTFGARFRPMVTVSEYFSLAVTVILGMAVVFELPVLILFLTVLHLLTPGFLWRNARYAILLIFILAAAITPTPDVPTMMLFAAPLVGLYFLGIGLSYLVVRLRSRRA